MMTQQRVASPQSSEDRFDLDDDLGACIFHTSFSATVIWYPPKHTAGWQAMRGGPLFGERALDMVICCHHLGVPQVPILRRCHSETISRDVWAPRTFSNDIAEKQTGDPHSPPRDHYPFINKDYSPDASDEDAAKSAPTSRRTSPNLSRLREFQSLRRLTTSLRHPHQLVSRRIPSTPLRSLHHPPPDHKPTGPTHGKPRPPPPSPAHKPKKPKNGAPKPPPHPPALKPKDLKDGGSKKKLPPKPPHKEGPKEGPKYSKPDASTPK
ncbi:hypothetical protein KEM48_000419 [Puccinia striiformis f. sp. tritici PST-130]|nr:hypothetical protein KEM48_000419 [Puccinia striiformis f. sp. tritici PST-130]